MATTITDTKIEGERTGSSLLQLLGEIRKINLESGVKGLASENLLQQLQHLSKTLNETNHSEEAAVLNEVFRLATTSTNLGGLGISTDGKDTVQLTSEVESEILFLVSAHLEALNSIARAKAPTKPLKSRPEGRRGMTIAEKIFAAHDIDRRGEVAPGDVIRTDVDWVLSSELSWGVSRTLFLGVRLNTARYSSILIVSAS
jgi:hypothetical protein